MAANKIYFQDEPIIDLTDTTAVEGDVAQGKIFHKVDGTVGVGTATVGGGLAINVNIINGTSAGASATLPYNTAEIELIPNEGYKLPNEIEVIGTEDYSYSKTKGKLEISPDLVTPMNMTVNIVCEEFIPDAPYITLTGSVPGILSVHMGGGIHRWDGIIEYATWLEDPMNPDTGNWSEWDGSYSIESSSGYIYLRGTGNTVLANTSTGQNQGNFIFELSPAVPETQELIGVYMEGNIETLLDYQTVERGAHPPMGDYCFRRVFGYNEQLLSTPRTPAEVIPRNGYDGMFRNNINLQTISKIYATEYGNTALSGMYRQGSIGLWDYEFEGSTPFRIPDSETVTSTGSNVTQYMFLDNSVGGNVTAPNLETTYYTNGRVID